MQLKTQTISTHILAEIHVGTQPTCPPGKECPGKVWSADFCAIFAEPLQRIGPGYRYRRCEGCIEAALVPVTDSKQPPRPPPKKIPQNHLDVFKDHSQ